MKVGEIMTLGAASVTADTSLWRALRILAEHRISALPVVEEDGRLVGIVTEADLFGMGPPGPAVLLAMPPETRQRLLEAMTVRAVMTPSPIGIGADASLEEAVALMEGHCLKRLPVVGGGKVVGLLSRADVLGALTE